MKRDLYRFAKARKYGERIILGKTSGIINTTKNITNKIK